MSGSDVDKGKCRPEFARNRWCPCADQTGTAYARRLRWNAALQSDHQDTREPGMEGAVPPAPLCIRCSWTPGPPSARYADLGRLGRYWGRLAWMNPGHLPGCCGGICANGCRHTITETITDDDDRNP